MKLEVKMYQTSTLQEHKVIKPSNCHKTAFGIVSLQFIPEFYTMETSHPHPPDNRIVAKHTYS